MPFAYELITEDVNIYNEPLPPPMPPIGPHTTHLTLGDLHANVIKLLFSLTRHGVISSPPLVYDRLVQLYRLPTYQHTKISLQEFAYLIQLIKIQRTDLLIRLIGDETADRGQCDYFILLLLKQLRDNGIQIEILFSNHGAEFILVLEYFILNMAFYCPNHLEQYQSLRHLESFFNQGFIPAQTLIELITLTYQPCLTLLSYDYDAHSLPQSLTLYSHAPIDLSYIQHLAHTFRVSSNIQSAQGLSETLNHINRCFKDAVRSHNIHTLYDKQGVSASHRDYDKIYPFLNPKNVLISLVWNRVLTLNRDPIKIGFLIQFVHGHTTYDLTDHYDDTIIHSLDSDLGKQLWLNRGKHKALCAVFTPPIPQYTAQSEDDLSMKRLPSSFELFPSSSEGSPLADAYHAPLFPRGEPPDPMELKQTQSYRSLEDLA